MECFQIRLIFTSTATARIVLGRRGGPGVRLAEVGSNQALQPRRYRVWRHLIVIASISNVVITTSLQAVISISAISRPRRIHRDVRNGTGPDSFSAQHGVSTAQRNVVREKQRRGLSLLWRKNSGIHQESSLFLLSNVSSTSSI